LFRTEGVAPDRQAGLASVSHTRLPDAEFEVWRGFCGSGDQDRRRGRRRYKTPRRYGFGLP